MAEMKFNAEEKNQMLSLTTDTVVTHEVSEEFILPDYVPEIRKLLHTKTGVLPESKYMGDEGEDTSLEIGGTVTYLLIYTDDEGQLCSLPLTSGYEAKTVVSGHPTAVFVDTHGDATSARVLAPRKIAIKTRLKSRVQCWETREEKERIENKSAADELFMEKSLVEINSLGIRQVSMSGIKMSDRLDSHGLRGLRPLWCDATSVINDVRAQKNSVSVRGEATVRCVCMNGDEAVTLTKEMTIAEELEAEGVCQGDMARVISRPVSLSISNEQNGDTEELFFDLSCELEGEAVRNSACAVTRDCYSTKYETSEEYKTVEAYSAACIQGGSFTLSEGVKRKSRDITKIIDVLCDPVYEKTEFKGGRATVVGKLSVTVIGACQGEKETSYQAENYDIPFKYSVDVGGVKEPVARCEACVGSVSARLDADQLRITAEVYISLEIMDKERVKALASCALKKDKEIKKDAGCVRVYFPKEGDTLWEIAKKYHTTVAALKEQNGIEKAELEGERSVIV